MKDQIQKLFEELKSLITHDTYALTNDNINEMSWKINSLEDEILKMYEGKRFD